ncbi:MAG: hypothetical protein KBS61_06155, partial [Chryseobacterium sp.]|nr:hypothetical protein [Candidatus Chryseobacterium enterohippi]
TITMICNLSKAQIGINTSSPRTTLDVKEKRIGSNNADSDPASADGIIIPKLTASELASKDINAYKARELGVTTGFSSHEGTLVYVINDGSNSVIIPTSGPSLSKVSEVKVEGFYYYGNDNKWHLLGDSIWSRNSANNRVELKKTSTDLTRPAKSEVVISDSGFLGIGLGSGNPEKRLDIDAANGSNTTDAIKISNLSNSVTTIPVSTLLIDSNGNISKNSTENIEGQVIRLPIKSAQALAPAPLVSGYTVFQQNVPTPIPFEVIPLPAPNNTPNLINTIKNSEILVDVPVTGNNPRSTDRIKLPKGLYKVEAKIIGNFGNVTLNGSGQAVYPANTTSSPNTSIRLTAFLDNEIYSEQDYGSNTIFGNVRYTGFTYVDFINLENDGYLDFMLESFGNNFTLVGSVDVSVGVRTSFRSVILIERLK